MKTTSNAIENTSHQDGIAADKSEYMTARIDGQMFGLPVGIVRDILRAQKMTHIPLSPSEIAGALNLRGRIITAFDVRKHLGLGPREAGGNAMNIVVESGDELYGLIVDEIGEVLSLPMKDFEDTPATLDAKWKTLSKGIFRLQDQLMVSLDVEGLLEPTG